MCLNDSRFGSLAQDLQQIIIADEIESGKTTAFLFQKLIETLLASFKSIQHCGQDAFDRSDLQDCHNSVVTLAIIHDHSEVIVNFAKDLFVIEPLKKEKNLNF